MSIKSFLVFLILISLATVRVMQNCNLETYRCIGQGSSKLLNNTDSFSKAILFIRDITSSGVRQILPSPHSELLLGLTLGINDLKLVPTFNDVLVSTGTIHAVVVSGYNINLVFSILIRILGSKYKFRNFFIANLLTLLYALISGFQAPVIRAWFMSFIVSLGKYYGRSINTYALLLFCAVVMVSIWPYFLFSMSFQLSFLATLSLVSFSESISALFRRFIKIDNSLLEDFYTSLSAQILVWPLISYKFGRVSILSPFVNSLVSWTISLATILGFILIVLLPVSIIVAKFLSIFTYFILDFFVVTTRLFSIIPYCSVEFRLDFVTMILYYTLTFLALFYIKSSKKLGCENVSV